MKTRKPDYRLSLPRFMCGHDRVPENMDSRGGCRACVHRRALRYKPVRAKLAKARKEAKAVAKAARAKARGITQKPWIVPTSASYRRLIAEARAQYLRETGSEQGRVQDSTDRRQHNLWSPR